MPDAIAVSSLDHYIANQNASRLNAYASAPGDITEHAGIEEVVLAGGYGYRQLLELIQNAADAILEGEEDKPVSARTGKIEAVLTDTHLYVANTGAAFSEEGVNALLRSHSSPKRGNQIGRFGLGFKSLLGLEGRIDVFGKSGAFRFDPERCKRELAERFPACEKYPGLRLAWPITRSEELADSVLDSLLTWATTVVRVSIHAGDMQMRLHEEIKNFPSEFLLFLPVSVELRLNTGELSRQVHRAHDGETYTLTEGDKVRRWRVVECEARIVEAEAIKDATHLHHRDVVPLAWAVPLVSNDTDAGRFWAFFATQTVSRVPGILNAPWKLNSDRNSLIPGAWNSALMKQAAALIAESLPRMATSEDPGKPLDVFPRQLERKDEIAAPLVNALWEVLIDAEIVADATGRLRKARDLRRPPMDDASLHEQWSRIASQGERTNWIHYTCLYGQRLNRLEALAKQLDWSSALRQKQGLDDWFSVVASTNCEQALAVLHLAEAVSRKTSSADWELQRDNLEIIPSAEDKLSSPDALVLLDDAQLAPQGVSLVNPCLIHNSEAYALICDVMGVQPLDDERWGSLLCDAKHDNDHALLWKRLRLAPMTVREDFLERHKGSIRILACDQAWVAADEVLFPGKLVEEGGPLNSGVLVDPTFHAGDETYLRKLGVVDRLDAWLPPKTWPPYSQKHEKWLTPWLSSAKRDYRGKLDTSSSPQDGYLKPTDKLALPRAWPLLAELQGAARARLSDLFLETADNCVSLIKFGHSTRPGAYPTTQISHPFFWYLREHGCAVVGNRTVPFGTLIARNAELDKLGVELPRNFQIISGSLLGAPTLKAPTPESLGVLWQGLFEERVSCGALTDGSLKTLWRLAAADNQVPLELPGPSGQISLDRIYVTASDSLARLAADSGKTIVSLDEATLALWAKRGARRLDGAFQPVWDGEVLQIGRLRNVWPELGEVMTERAKSLALGQAVRGLHLRFEDVATLRPCVYHEGRLIYDAEQLARQTHSDRIAAVLAEVEGAGWLRVSKREALGLIADAEAERRRQAVKECRDDVTRLLKAVGDKADLLRVALGEALDGLPREHITPGKLAELALALFGPTALVELREALEAEGLKPPKRWGGDEARAFVAALGFPEAFAAAAETRREAETRISGPLRLPELHDYQKEVFDKLGALFSSSPGRRRAVVSLPTGGGKTRVVVQAAVELILKPLNANRVVLWVAQTDELCEQAVQAFRQVWLNRGAENTELRIVRYWGGHPDPAPTRDRAPTAIIASIQTLNSRIGRDTSAWLDNPGLVVIDECHHAIAPSYTSLLKWLDAAGSRFVDDDHCEPPIVGLSATPFRGNNDDEENRRLAGRFDKYWLPSDQASLYARLTGAGMLSRPVYERLRSPYELDESWIDRLTKIPRNDGVAQDRVLEELNDLLAGDEQRNRLLVKTIQGASARSILFFASSVKHAELIAARLNLVGVSAAAVSGKTSTTARRYFLDRFQRGELRVLCNHSVLTTGFDAPKTDMILISRLVMSPVRYMQMVGRGLRGVKNGGTETCRIVTVTENLGAFGKKLPYQYCEKYFQSGL